MRDASASWVAAYMTLSGVASARSRSAVMRPSRTTSTRSAMPSTSGSSEEIIRIARPCPASSESRRCTSALVPTSMPRVGSSMISSVGFGGQPLGEDDLLLVAAAHRRGVACRARWS